MKTILKLLFFITLSSNVFAQPLEIESLDRSYFQHKNLSLSFAPFEAIYQNAHFEAGHRIGKYLGLNLSYDFAFEKQNKTDNGDYFSTTNGQGFGIAPKFYFANYNKARWFVSPGYGVFSGTIDYKTVTTGVVFYEERNGQNYYTFGDVISPYSKNFLHQYTKFEAGVELRFLNYLLLEPYLNISYEWLSEDFANTLIGQYENSGYFSPLYEGMRLHFGLKIGLNIY